MRSAFWVASLGVIGMYLFFFALGAFTFDEVLPVTVVVAILVALWAVHAYLQSRSPHQLRDPRLIRSRERRGF